MRALDPDQRVQPVGSTPPEPASERERVEGVGAAGVAARNETAASCAVDIDAGWKGKTIVVDMEPPHAANLHEPRPRSPLTRGQGTWTHPTLDPRSGSTTGGEVTQVAVAPQPRT